MHCIVVVVVVNCKVQEELIIPKVGIGACVLQHVRLSIAKFYFVSMHVVGVFTQKVVVCSSSSMPVRERSVCRQ